MSKINDYFSHPSTSATDPSRAPSAAKEVNSDCDFDFNLKNISISSSDEEYEKDNLSSPISKKKRKATHIKPRLSKFNTEYTKTYPSIIKEFDMTSLKWLLLDEEITFNDASKCYAKFCSANPEEMDQLFEEISQINDVHEKLKLKSDEFAKMEIGEKWGKIFSNKNLVQIKKLVSIFILKFQFILNFLRFQFY